MAQRTPLNKLSLEQKCALLSGEDTFRSRGLKRHGIRSLWLSDGPHGLRKQEGASDHLGLNPAVKATCFPTAATMAASWNPALGEEIGKALGEECVNHEVAVLLGPGLNIKRNPLCGRNFEYFSEDPILAGRMAAAYVRGIQSKGVSACPKHFAVNSQETRRMANDSIVDERTLREIYLTGFEIAVREGQPWSIMTSYNLVNGTYANENRHILMDILRREWDYKRLVVTDWGGSNDHALGVQNGSTLEMPAPGYDSVRELVKAVKSGKITEADVDARVQELLDLTDFVTPALEGMDKDREGKTPAYQKKLAADLAAHHALARKAAGECVVLLKNEGGILPLSAGAKVALIGDFAQNPRYQGAGSSQVNSNQVDTLVDQVKAGGLDLVGVAGGFDRTGAPNETLRNEAVALAKKADTVLLCLGLTEVNESEGLDRLHMRLADNQIALLDAVAAVNPRIVVLFHAGSAVEMPWLDKCQALLNAGLGGEAGAGAMVDVLTGKVNPSAKLAETWLRQYEDTPSLRHFAGDGRNSEFREGLFVGYRYTQKANVPVLFPFGFGMSYTTFAYSDLRVSDRGVTVKVTNTGARDGAEIVQLYVGHERSVLPRPEQELKGFAKVWLKPGESQDVEIPFDDYTFRYWNVKTSRWEIEGGDYTIRVGASCEDIRLQALHAVVGTKAPDPYAGKELSSYRAGKVQDLPDTEFAALLGHAIPQDKVKIDRNITLGQLNHGRSPIGWLVAAVLKALLNKSIRNNNPDLNMLFMYNMPLRAMAKMAGGMVSMGMVDGMVMEFQGFWIIGLLRVLVEFIKNLILNAQTRKQVEG